MSKEKETVGPTREQWAEAMRGQLADWETLGSHKDIKKIWEWVCTLPHGKIFTSQDVARNLYTGGYRFTNAKGVELSAVQVVDHVGKILRGMAAVGKLSKHSRGRFQWTSAVAKLAPDLKVVPTSDVRPVGLPVPKSPEVKLGLTLTYIISECVKFYRETSGYFHEYEIQDVAQGKLGKKVSIFDVRLVMYGWFLTDGKDWVPMQTETPLSHANTTLKNGFVLKGKTAPPNWRPWINATEEMKLAITKVEETKPKFNRRKKA